MDCQYLEGTGILVVFGVMRLDIERGNAWILLLHIVKEGFFSIVKEGFWMLSRDYISLFALGLAE
jgi:hypothetical protein